MTKKPRKAPLLPDGGPPPPFPHNGDAVRERIMGPVEAASYLRVSLSSIQRWIDSGAIPARRTLGGHRRILEKELIAFAEREGILFEHPQSAPLVFVVDDDESYLESFVERIEAMRPDIELLSALNGFDAGRLVLQRPPQLMFLDIRLPGLDGIDVCRTIKGEDETKETHVVGMTGFARKTEIDELLAAGADSVLLKPIKDDILRAILARCAPAGVSPQPPRKPVSQRSRAATR
jgi:excisionase family DNA binding protein